MNRHIGQTHEDAASKLPKRGTGLETGTAREERGKGTPLTDEERAERHKATKTPEGYVDVVVDGRLVRRTQSYHDELQATKPTAPQKQRGFFYRRRNG